MEDNIQITMLYDIYGKLLTEKQQAIFEEYYTYNLSLREIAQNKKISYQAVRDSIKNSQESLKKFEKVLGEKAILQKLNRVLNILEENDNINEKRLELINILKK